MVCYDRQAKNDVQILVNDWDFLRGMRYLDTRGINAPVNASFISVQAIVTCHGVEPWQP